MPAVQHPRYAGVIGATTTNQIKDAVAVTPSDANELDFFTNALWVGNAGTVNLVLQDDTAPVSFTVPAGTLLPFHVKQVRLTGTSAGNIVALY